MFKTAFFSIIDHRATPVILIAISMILQIAAKHM